MQIDLINYFNLKCIRILVIELTVYPEFKYLEFSFGNKSRNEELTENLFIFKTGDGHKGKVFEYCLDHPLVGKYIQIDNKITNIHLGEIQILVG